LLATLDNLAVVVHLAQPALGVALGSRHDQDVIHPLTGSRPDVEAVSDHGFLRLPFAGTPPDYLRINGLARFCTDAALGKQMSFPGDD
jgi:hypothetical protein